MRLKGKYQKILLDYLIGWLMASLVWELLSDNNLEGFVDSGDHELLLFLAFWLIQGLSYGLIHIVILHYVVRRVKFVRFLILSLTLQLLTIFLVLVVAFYLLDGIDVFDSTTSLWEFIQLPIITKALTFTLITNFMISVVIQINMMLGGGNLFKMIIGEFYTPKTVKRIFMFLDLRSSTTIAEKLGHGLFSQMIQDCFYDLSVVHQYKAEIYQYVGDEAVLVWTLPDGTEQINCLEAFFTFRQRILARSDHYLEKYDTIPVFKAGLNVGEITMAEVGEFKKEIAYHGDTINTAARIQDQCNKLGSDLLISEYLLEELDLNFPYTSTLKGEIQMKGKLTKVKIYAIDRTDYNYAEQTTT